jgi:hypothetical protein
MHAAARITGVAVVTLGVVLVALAWAGRASAQQPVEFTTTQFPTPEPVAPGGTVSWFMQGLNQGEEALENIQWTVIDPPGTGCVSNYPGTTYTTGQTTPFGVCHTTAPQSGEASITVQWQATVVSTGEMLTPQTTTTDPVQEPTTTTSTTTTSTSTTTTTVAPTTTTSSTTSRSSTTVPTRTTTTAITTMTSTTVAAVSAAGGDTTTVAVASPLPEPTSPATGLAATGSDPAAELPTGAGLVAFGAVVVWLARPRARLGAHFRSHRRR